MMMENKIQKQIIDWFRLQNCNNDRLIFSNHNNANNIGSAMVARSQGRIAGIPDLTILLENCVVIFIEVKTEKSKLTKTQKIIHTKMNNLHHKVFIVRNLNDMIDLFQDYIT